MQIWHINEYWMLFTYFILWPLLQVAIALLINRIPASLFHKSGILNHEYWIERHGKLYTKVFFVQKWKYLVPDGAKAHKSGFRKKHFKHMTPEYIYSFIGETTRAEFIHWVEIIPFFVFGFWSPMYVVWVMLGYVLILNLPPIMLQRYNRPRLKKLYKMLLKREKK